MRKEIIDSGIVRPRFKINDIVVIRIDASQFTCVKKETLLQTEITKAYFEDGVWKYTVVSGVLDFSALIREQDIIFCL